jgi:type IV pilus assembly protein PilY1
VYKWFAVFGSGVNNNANDGKFSTTGKPALFILDLGKAAGTAWAEGVNYYKVSLPVDATLAATTAPGLINFRAALGLGREVTEIYMGDLHGNVWKLNFAAYGAANWNIDNLSYFNKGTVGAPLPYPMFIAKDGTGVGAKVQPISAAPNLVFGKEPGTTLVIVGTGKYLEVADKSSTDVQSVYMLYDNGSAAGDASPVGDSAISGRGRLKAGTANASTGLVSIPDFTLGRATNNTDTSNPRSGWYFDFPVSKERQISNGTVFGDKLIFGSLIPAVSAAAGSCSATGGGGNQYTIDVFTGDGTFLSSSVGILGEPLVAELGSAVYTKSDSTGRRVKTITSQVFQQGSNGVAAANTSTRTVAAGRLSWRQINNYQDLKNAP